MKETDFAPLTRRSCFLQSAIGSVSFTFDLWSDKSMRSYMGVTAHYAVLSDTGDELQIKAALIAFRHVEGEHTGDNLGRVLYGILKSLKLTNKVIFRVKGIDARSHQAL